MSELKTLKDLIKNIKLEDGTIIAKNVAVNIDDLRQEAIKWIKVFRYRLITMNPEEVIPLAGHYWTHGRMSGAISILMLFFNITKEDLK